MKSADMGLLVSEEYASAKFVKSPHHDKKMEGKKPQPTCDLQPPLLNHFHFDRVIKKRGNDAFLWHDFTSNKVITIYLLMGGLAIERYVFF